MKDSYICSILLLLLCGCIAAPVINDTQHSTQPNSATINTQGIDRVPNASNHNTKQTEISASSISQNRTNNFTQKHLWPSETGIATYYAPAMEGRNTASGEPYDPEQLTAAHRTIPIGSNVRVTNLKTKQQIIVRINDRWGGGGDRIINLSKRATIQLGFGSAGTMPIQLDVESIPSSNDVQPRVKAQALPARLEENSIRNHSRLNVCQNEADILGLTENFYHNHVTACLSRSE
ncbi:septal ring lytic transglycosylase RlpA family protein [Nitrosomonas sp.]|uniref:septal ring lytic transglycosylase RlpA family protein n=2 Tax=Nitrosomonas sp. TaxID=42353 RepID=UPI0027316B60|nr:septal ring lytic transglycosylase RlpA family protein [Nitrosomonas sp.]MDP1786228.1 septal ring lytic transglycosylase RlpA family protein [Nitrosomonas sp.]